MKIYISLFAIAIALASHASAATTTLNGTVVINASGEIKSNLPPSPKIYCHFFIYITPTADVAGVLDKTLVLAATTSDSSFSCSGKIAYRVEADPTQAMLYISVQPVAVDPALPVSNAIQGGGPPLTGDGYSFPIIALPANGATTTKTYTAFVL
ncbi:MAG TPA: hypothetical protein VME69_11125 [Methylocella sp.]|nr:hypothetical protein [Methylocella sp.]